ncbi:MAG: substrate-binding domain-containing protein [Chloroflexi bacterium]|nr:substrate-binding domain-containing protein [Chloroflexota bacterium]
MKKPTIGIITNNQYGVFQRDTISGVREIAQQSGYEVIVDSLAEDPLHPRSVSLDWQKLTGVVAIANATSDELLRQIYESGKPISLVGHRVPGTPIPAVTSNNNQGMAELVKHLVKSCDRRKFVYIRGEMNQDDAIQRETVFRHELMRYNLPAEEMYFVRGDFDPEIAAASIRELLELQVYFDAVLAADYQMAIVAMELLQMAGIKVPEEVSIAGFGDAPAAQAAGLTTVSADILELGRRATRQLIGQVNGLTIQGVTTLSVQLMIRATSCPA